MTVRQLHFNEKRGSMRRIIIQIICLYYALFYLAGGVLLFKTPVGIFLLICGLLHLIVLVKISKFKSKTHMLYNSLFLYISLLVNGFIVHRFPIFSSDIMSQYLYLTLPEALKFSFSIANLLIFLLALVEFANAKVME